MPSLALDRQPLQIPEISITGDFTIESWIFLTPKGNDPSDGRDGIFKGQTKDGSAVNLNFHGTFARLFSHGDEMISDGKGGQSYNQQGDQVVTTKVPNAGDWIHYALVRENGVLKFYINGEEAETSLSKIWTDDFNITHLGAGHNGESLKGSLDEFRVWNEARTAEEIAENYQHTVPTDSDALARYYRFDLKDKVQDETGRSDDMALLKADGGLSQISVTDADAGILTPLALGNSGFEEAVVKGAGSGVSETGRWVLSGDTGTFVPTPQQINNGAPEGQKVAFINGRGEISQALSAVVLRQESGTYQDYILRVKVGDDKSDLGDATSWQVRLYAGETLLGRITSQEVNVSDGAFAQAELVIPAEKLFELAQRAAVYGQKLKIVLSDTGDAEGQVRFDDVALFSRASSFTPPEADAQRLSVGDSIMLDFQAATGAVNGPPPVTSQWDPDGADGPMGSVWNPFIIGPGQTYGGRWAANSVLDGNIALTNLKASHGNVTGISLRVDGKMGAYNVGGGHRTDPSHIDSMIRDHHYFDLKGDKVYGDRWNAEEQTWEQTNKSWGARGPTTYTYSGLQSGVYSLEFFINPTAHDPPREYEVNINGETEADGTTLKWRMITSQVTDPAHGRGNPDSDNRMSVNDIRIGDDGELRIQYRGPSDEHGSDPSPAGIILTFEGPAEVESDNSDIDDLPSEGRFSTQLVAPDLDAATDLKFLPDGSMLVLNKDGQVLRFADPSSGDMTKTVVMTIPKDGIESGYERGLLAVEIHPDFVENGHFYLFYSKELPSGEVKTTVSRFTMKTDRDDQHDPNGTLASEFIIWQENDEVSHHFHQGGGLSIGWNPVDGKPKGETTDPNPYKLFITTGEEFNPANSKDLAHPDGKTHRVNLDGSIPSDNPFYDEEAAGGYDPSQGAGGSLHNGMLMTIWSSGLRNPWRAHFDETLQRLFIGEVGGNDNKAGGSTEDIHVAERSADHGWTGEGSEESYDAQDGGTPLHLYQHYNGPGGDGQTLTGANGASVTGGLVYRYDGAGKFKFPDEYQGKYFYGDWVRNWIRSFDIETIEQTDGGHGLRKVEGSDTFFDNTPGQPLAFTVGPDGAIYFITTHREGGVFDFSSRIYRITFSDNLPLTGTGIVIGEGQQESISLPEDGHVVTFSVDVKDPDGPDGELRYSWDFDYGRTGDEKLPGATSTEKAPTFTYTKKGVFTVLLTVTDSKGTTTTFDVRKIRIGNPPEVSVEVETTDSGASTKLYEAGQYARLKASATDVEDGDLPSGNIRWSSELVHNEHSHPGSDGVLDADGYQVFDIPDTGHGYPGPTFYRVAATARDASGMESTETVDLTVKKTQMTFVAPSDNYKFHRVKKPGEVEELPEKWNDAAVGFSEVIQAQSYYDDGVIWRYFSHWKDDPTNTNPTRLVKVPEEGMTLEPVYAPAPPITDPILRFRGEGSLELHSASQVTIAESGDFTIEMWVNLNDPISNEDALISGSRSGGGVFDMNFHDGKLRLYSGNDAIISKLDVSESKWIHVALVRHNSKLKLFLDGRVAAEHDPLNTDEAWSSGFTVKHIGKGFAGTLDGYLDNIRFWSNAKSDDDIAGIHSKGRGKVSEEDRGEAEGLLRDFGVDSKVGRLVDFANPSNPVAVRPAHNFDIPDWTVATGADFTIETLIRIPDSVSNFDSIALGRTSDEQPMDLNFYAGKFRLYDGADRIVSNKAIAPDTWAHVAIVRENGYLSLYVDGVMTQSRHVWNKAFTLAFLNKGVMADGKSEFKNMRFWTAARSREELAANEHEVLKNVDSLERQYDFNDATGEARETISGSSVVSSSRPSFLIADSSRAENPAVRDYAPVPVPDHVLTTVGRPVSVSVLENDVDDLTKSADLVLVAASLTDPTNGAVEIDRGKGIVTFTPGKGVSGRVTIRYEVTDSAGNSGFGELVVFVGFDSHLPVAVDDSAVTWTGVSRVIDVLANDTDVEGDDLKVVSARALNGRVEITKDYKIIYTPNAGFSGKDEITYELAQAGDLEAFTKTGSVDVVVRPTNHFVPDAPVLVRPGPTVLLSHILENDRNDEGGDLRIVNATAKFGGIAYSPDGELKYAAPRDPSITTDTIFYDLVDSDGNVDRAYLQIVIQRGDAPPEVDWSTAHLSGSTVIRSLGVDNGGFESHGDQDPGSLNSHGMPNSIFVPDAPVAVRLGQTVTIGHLTGNDREHYVAVNGQTPGWLRIENPVAELGKVSQGYLGQLTYVAPTEATNFVDIVYYDVVDSQGNRNKGYLYVVLQDGESSPEITLQRSGSDNVAHWLLDFDQAGQAEQEPVAAMPEIA